MSALGKNECWRKNIMSGPEKMKEKYKIQATDVKNKRQESKKIKMNIDAFYCWRKIIMSVVSKNKKLALGKNECWRKKVMSGPEKLKEKHKIEATDVKNIRQKSKKTKVNGWSFLLLT